MKNFLSCLVTLLALAALSDHAYGQCEVAGPVQAPVPDTGDEFGHSVRLGDDIAVIGAWEISAGQSVGSAYFFRRIGSQWTLDDLNLPQGQPDADDYFGSSVAVVGELAVIGAMNRSYGGSGWGVAYAFRFDGDSWNWEHTFFPQNAQGGPDPLGGEFFGRTVALGGDIVVVGALDTAGQKATAYVYRHTGSTWVQEAKLTAANGRTAFYEHESSVAVLGNTIALGADEVFGASSGAVSLFRYNGSAWVADPNSPITAPSAHAGDGFGCSIDLEDDALIVGAYNHNSKGAAFIYRDNGSQFTHEQTLTRTGGQNGDEYGYAVAIEGTKAVVGAPGAVAGASTGRAYLYTYNGSTWGSQFELTTAAGTTGRYGNSVARDGHFAIVGAKAFDGFTGAAHIFDVDDVFCDAPDSCDNDPPIFDCNNNGIEDECDLYYDVSPDCNENFRPDDCDLMPFVELVFIVDTSVSMTNGGDSQICTELEEIEAELRAALAPDVAVSATYLKPVPSAEFGSLACLATSVEELFGFQVPQCPGASPLIPTCCPNLGRTAGGAPVTANEANQEDWGTAIPIVADAYPWTSDARVIIAVSDAAPRLGGETVCDADDEAITAHAICLASLNNVIILPIAANRSGAVSVCTRQKMDAMIQQTFDAARTHFESADPTLVNDMVQAIVDHVTDVQPVAVSQDCNGNEVPDECDVEIEDCNGNQVPDDCDVEIVDCNDNQTPDDCEPDCDGDGIPDNCEITQGAPDCNGNGVPDSCDIGTTSTDMNGNSIPDDCEDCNNNLFPDEFDILFGLACDYFPPPANAEEERGNGIPDDCEMFCPEGLEQPMGDCAPYCAVTGKKGDSVVSIVDVLKVVTSFGSTTDLQCDIAPPGGDGVITIGDVVDVVTAFGTECASGFAPPVNSLIAVEVADFSNGYKDEQGNIQEFAAEVAAAWATFSANWDVYRVFVEVQGPTDRLDAVSSFDQNTLKLVIQNKAGNFYNHAQGTNLPPNVWMFETQPELAFDTFITLGSATSGSGISIIGTLNLSQNVFATNTGWYKIGGAAPVPGGSTGHRILIGQFTVPKGKKFGGSGLISGATLEEYAAFSSGP